MHHDFNEVKDAIPTGYDEIFNKILERQKDVAPHERNQIAIDVVTEMMPGASEKARKRVITELSVRLWMKTAEEAHATMGTETGTTNLGKAVFIGRISPKPKYSGKDEGAMAAVEDRLEALAEDRREAIG